MKKMGNTAREEDEEHGQKRRREQEMGAGKRLRKECEGGDRVGDWLSGCQWKMGGGGGSRNRPNALLPARWQIFPLKATYW